MADADFRRRLLAGEILNGTFLSLGAPIAAELASRAGFDWVLVDLEHGAVGEADLLPMLHALGAGSAAPLVRVERADRLRIGRALDLGAAGVMVPQVQSVAEAELLGAALRYQPGGSRGIMTFTRGMDWGAGGHAAVAGWHERVTGIAQVETGAAVDLAPELAAVGGVDCLFVGPADLSHALGVPGQLDAPVFDAAVRRVGRAARDAGKAAGIMLWKPEDAARFRDLGYTVFSLSNDGAILTGALRGFLEGTRRALGA
ncbi:MAG: HpcH/HpaI aldolase family protein [Chloroflexota bacterium]